MRWVLLVGGLLFAGQAWLGQSQVETITLKAWTVGPDDPSITRMWNLELATEQLNIALAAKDAPYRVKLEATFTTTTWSDYKSANLLALGSGDPNQIADLLITGHEDIGPYATAGYIIPLDDCIKKYHEVYDDFIPALWDAVKFKGHIWGIPQDTEARMFYYNKELLREAGYSDDFIESIPERVRNGEFTLDDIIAIGKKLVESGAVEPEKAIWHRPTPGTDWFQFIFAYGGRIYDPDSGRLVFPKGAVLKTLQFIKALVDNKLTPAAMSQIAWPEIHSSFAKDQVIGIWLTGGSWNWSEWQHDPYNVPESELFEKIGFAPIPAGEKGGQPVSVSHPLVYMITAVTSSADQPELHQELACELITHASSVELTTDHAVHSGHLAVRQAQLNYWRYAENEFAKRVSEEVSPYARFSPNHEKAPKYWEIIFKEGIVPVETGTMTPQAAVQHLEQRLKAEIPDIIVE